MTAANAYDTVEYPSDAYHLTHPDRLACHGRIFGLATADPGRCRFLELGCGAGTNILAMATEMPGSQFVGIDLAGSAIAQAQRHAAELQLGNVSFQQADIADAGAVRGEFDFIVAHGVFSWVPLAVRHALLAVCSRHLAAQGVAYISYNALPGCRIRQMVREMLQYHVRLIADPEKRREQCRSFMRFLVAAEIAPEPYASLLRSEAERVAKSPMGLTIHDDLAEVNQPYFFHEFIALAQEHGLQFLAEASLVDMSSLSIAPAVREASAALEQDLLQKEQYLDFMRGRFFRQTLLCRGDRRLERSDAADHGVTDLLVSANAQLVPARPGDASGHCSYRRGDELSITLIAPIANTLAQRLIAAWPLSLSFGQLEQLMAERHPQDGPSRSDLAGMIWDLAHTGLLGLRVAQAPCVSVISERPCVGPFARWQARSAPYVTSLLHETVNLDRPLLATLVVLLDGSRSVAEAVDDLTMRIAAGSLPRPDGMAGADRATLRASVARLVEQGLLELRRQGLLRA